MSTQAPRRIVPQAVMQMPLEVVDPAAIGGPSIAPGLGAQASLADGATSAPGRRIRVDLAENRHINWRELLKKAGIDPKQKRLAAPVPPPVPGEPGAGSLPPPPGLSRPRTNTFTSVLQRLEKTYLAGGVSDEDEEDEEDEGEAEADGEASADEADSDDDEEEDGGGREEGAAGATTTAAPAVQADADGQPSSVQVPGAAAGAAPAAPPAPAPRERAEREEAYEADFIDDSDFLAQRAARKTKTKYSGFYINKGAVERAEAQEDEEDTDDEPARRRSASLAGQASGAAGLPTAAAASKLKKPRKQAGEAGGLPGSPGGEARKRKQGAEGGGGASGQAKKPKHVQPIQMPASGGPAPAAVTWAGPLPTSHVMQVPGALPAAAGGVTNSSVSLARLAMTAGQQSASVPPAVEGTINQLMASAQRAPQAGAAAVPPPQEVARAMSILQGLGGAAGAQPASAPPPPPPPAAGGPVDVATQLHLFNSLRDKLSKAIKGKLATAAATAAVARAGGGAGEESDDFRAAPSFTWDIGLQNKLVELVEAYRPVAAAMDGKSAPDADRHIIGDVASMTRIAAQAANVPLAGADSPTQIQGALQHGERRKAAREARKAAAPPAGAALQPATSPSGATTPAGLSQPAAASQPAPVAAPAAAAIGTVATQQQQQAVLASARAPLAFVPAPAAPPPAAGAAAAVAAAPAPAAAPALPYPVPSAEQLAAMRDDILRQAVASGADEATLRADLMSTLPVTSTRHIFLLAVVSSGRAGLSVAEAPARVVELRLDPRWAREKCNYLTQLVGKKGLCNLMHRLKGFRFVSRAFDVSGLELDPGWAARVAKAMAAADEAAAAATGATQQQQPVE